MAGVAGVAEDLEDGEEIEGGGEVEVKLLWITGYFMILKGGDSESRCFLRPGR